MMAFTELELAALRSIFSETPELWPALEAQLADATVIERENSGAGFFTTIEVSDDASPVSCPAVLGHETRARVAELEYGLGFVLFMKGGKLHLLDVHSQGGEFTGSLDLGALTFEIYREPEQHIQAASLTGDRHALD